MSVVLTLISRHSLLLTLVVVWLIEIGLLFLFFNVKKVKVVYRHLQSFILCVSISHSFFILGVEILTIQALLDLLFLFFYVTFTSTTLMKCSYLSSTCEVNIKWIDWKWMKVLSFRQTGRKEGRKYIKPGIYWEGMIKSEDKLFSLYLDTTMKILSFESSTQKMFSCFEYILSLTLEMNSLFLRVVTTVSGCQMNI